MKIKQGITLKEIAGNFVVVPTKDELMDLSKMITINETGSLLFKAMENDVTLEHLCQVLKNEYEGASDDEIKNDVSDFVALLKENDILE